MCVCVRERDIYYVLPSEAEDSEVREGGAIDGCGELCQEIVGENHPCEVGENREIRNGADLEKNQVGTV